MIIENASDISLRCSSCKNKEQNKTKQKQNKNKNKTKKPFNNKITRTYKALFWFSVYQGNGNFYGQWQPWIVEYKERSIFGTITAMYIRYKSIPF